MYIYINIDIYKYDIYKYIYVYIYTYAYINKNVYPPWCQTRRQELDRAMFPPPMWHMTHSYVRLDSFIYAIWLIHMCDMTHSYVRHESFICATWLIHMCDMIHPYMRHGVCVCATWLIYMCDMAYSYERHDSIHMFNVAHNSSHTLHEGLFMSKIWIIPVAQIKKSLYTYDHLCVWHEIIHVCDINDTSVK